MSAHCCCKCPLLCWWIYTGWIQQQGLIEFPTIRLISSRHIEPPAQMHKNAYEHNHIAANKNTQVQMHNYAEDVHTWNISKWVFGFISKLYCIVLFVLASSKRESIMQNNVPLTILPSQLSMVCSVFTKSMLHKKLEQRKLFILEQFTVHLFINTTKQQHHN